MKRISRLILCASFAASLALCTARAHAQFGRTPPDTVQQSAQHGNNLPADNATVDPRAERLARWIIAARQKQLVKDSAQLVELTAQFRQSMAMLGDRKLNPDDLKLIARIEKLARSIRQSMADADDQLQQTTSKILHQ